MKKVLKGESIKRSTTIEGDIATCEHVTQHSTIGNVHTIWQFSFEDVTREELIRYAVRSLLIDCRRTFKELSESDAEEYEDTVISVRDIIDTPATRTKKPTISQLKTLLGKMSDAEREEFLQSLAE